MKKVPSLIGIVTLTLTSVIIGSVLIMSISGLEYDDNKWLNGVVPPNGMIQVTDFFNTSTRIYGDFLVGDGKTVSFLICDDSDFILLNESPYADITRHEYQVEVTRGDFDFTVPYPSYWHLIFMNLKSESVYVEMDSWIVPPNQTTESPSLFEEAILYWCLAILVSVCVIGIVFIKCIKGKQQPGYTRRKKQNDLGLAKSDWELILSTIRRILCGESGPLWEFRLKMKIKEAIAEKIPIRFREYDDLISELVTSKLLYETDDSCIGLQDDFDEKEIAFLEQL